MPYVKGGGPQRSSGLPAISDVYHSTNVFVNNVEVATWDKPNGTGGTFGGVYIPDDPYTYDQAAEVINGAGTQAPHDDPDSTVVDYGVADNSSPETGIPVTDIAPSVVETGKTIACGTYITNPVDYSQKLSANYTIANLSTAAVFKHNIVAQNGYTVDDIICNLKALAENVIEPLRKQYPGFQINSGFRKGTSTSQHNAGMAVDVQWVGQSAAQSLVIAQWIKQNLPFDQLIFEHGTNNGVWLHISFNRRLAKQRLQLLTMYSKKSPLYTSGLTNYYA